MLAILLLSIAPTVTGPSVRPDNFELVAASRSPIKGDELVYELSFPEFRPVPGVAGAVVIGDVTGDGRGDIVVGGKKNFGPIPSHNVWVYPQLADGSIGPPLALPGPTSPRGRSDPGESR